jgi:hypothetical protein
MILTTHISGFSSGRGAILIGTLIFAIACELKVAHHDYQCHSMCDGHL